MGAPVVGRGEARIVQEILAFDSADETFPVTLVTGDGEHEPAAVPAAVEVGQRTDGLLAGWAHLGARPAKNALDGAGVHPEPVGHERGGHHGAASGALAMIETGHDRREQRHARGMIAHARQGAGGWHVG